MEKQEKEQKNVVGDLASTVFSFLSIKVKLIILAVIVFIIIIIAVLCMIIGSDNDATFLEDAILPIPMNTNKMTITSLMGNRDGIFVEGMEYHRGMDLVGDKDCNILAAYKGKVIVSGWNNSYGNTVLLQHTLDIDNDGEDEIVYTRYGHMKNSPLVKLGEEIEQGTMIGTQGSTGDSTGDHLHFEVLVGGMTSDCLKNPAPLLGIKDAHVGQVIKIEKSQHSGSMSQNGDGYSKITMVGIRPYKEYKQTRGSYAHESYWGGDIMNWGCGPTALAIVASGYGKNETPLSLANYIKDNLGNYTCNDILRKTAIQKCKLDASSYTFSSNSKIKETLKEGNPVIVSVTGSKGNGTLYTNGSHYLALLDINEKDQVYVSNPNEKMGGWRPLSEIIGCLQTFIIFK